MTDTDWLIRVEDLHKRFHVRREKAPSIKRMIVRLLRPYPHEILWALRGVNLTISPGHIVGLIGSNGSGKSTLLRVIGGVYVPTTGRVSVAGHVGVLFELESGFHGELSGMDNILLSGALMGYGRKAIQEALPRVLEISGLADFVNVPVKAYSSGMKFRLGFGIAMAFDPPIVLVDEVLAAADEGFQRSAYRWLEQCRDNGAAVVIVSHEMEAVRKHCDRVVWLADGQIRSEGPTEQVLDEYLRWVNHSPQKPGARSSGHS